MGVLDDFHYGREEQKKYAEKLNERKTTQKKKRQPNRLLVGMGIAYEMLNIDELIAKLHGAITPIILIVTDDAKWVWNKLRGKKIESPETSFNKWQIKERFSNIGKRFKR